MAADVRKIEEVDLDEVPRPPPVSPEESNISVCSGRSTSSLPSYIIVQKQMQDVVLAQKMAVEQLVKNNIDVLNASRASFSSTVQSQELQIKMLEKSIAEDFVPKQLYESLNTKLKEEYVPKKTFESLQMQLEQEYERHSQTQMKLQEVLDKLDSSLSEIAIITSQSEQDKAAFSASCDSLKDELSAAHAKNEDLESRLSEQISVCQRQKEQLLKQEEQIESLHQKQKQQMLKYQQIMTDTEVEKQQEAYLNKMLKETNKRRK